MEKAAEMLRQEKAIQSTVMPHKIRKIYNALNHIASLHSLEVVGIRDKKTGKEWR